MHTCPRRTGEYGSWDRAAENLDDYVPNHGLINQELGCTFCGSMPPEDFMAAVRNGAEIVPTDKSYKLYVHHVTPEDVRVDSKFYTMHLSPEQSQEFWELWGAGRINWGYPGYPYAKLYLPGLVREDER